MAGGAAHAGEAALEDAAVEEGEDRLLDATPPEAVAALEVLFPAPFDLLVKAVDEPEQQRLSRLARTIEGCARVGQGRGLLPFWT